MEAPTNRTGSPGLKFMRTLRVCDIAGGPQVYAATKQGSTQLGLDVAHRVRPWTTKETNKRGDDSHESNRGDGRGCGNGRDDAGGAARSADGDKRRHRSDSCVGIRPD